MGWGEATGPGALDANPVLAALARTGRTLALEADLGATHVENEFLRALVDAERWLGDARYGYPGTSPSPLGPPGPTL